MTKSFLTALGLASIAVVWSSSSPGAEQGGEQTGSTSQAIISGTTSPSSHDSVVLLIHAEDANHFSVCSGTLIAPNIVVTARHCVSQTTAGAFACDKNGNLSSDSSGGTIGADFVPSDITIFVGSPRPDVENAASHAQPNAVGKQIFHDDGTVICSHDLGVILLDRPISGAVIAPIRLDPPTNKGETFTAVGWGVSLDSDFPKQRQERSGIVIKEVGPFDGNSVDDVVPPNDFLVGESTCSGDSGGPALSDSSGAVIGVVSRGGNGKDDSQNASAGCIDASNDYTQTAPFKTIIQQAFNESGGYSPVVEVRNSSGDSGGCTIGPVGSRSTPGAAALVALGMAVVAVRRRRR